MSTPRRRFNSYTLLCLVVVASPVMAQNLLQNPDFDHDLSGWTIDTAGGVTATWQAVDSVGVPSSGSARVVNSSPGGNEAGISQCVAVTGGMTYELASRVFLPSSDDTSGGGQAGFRPVWFSSTSCATGTVIAFGVGQGIKHKGEWTQVPDFETAPATARSALVAFSIDKPAGGPNIEASFDHVFFGLGTPAAPGAAVTQYLPAVASVHGANASFFHSDVWITNLSYLSSALLNITYHCYPGEACNSTPHQFNIAPRATIAFMDIVGAYLAAPETAGGLEITYDPYLSPLAIASRLYTPSAQPTFGFSSEGLFLSDALTRGDFPGIAGGGPSGSGFRSNIGFYNPNDTAAAVTITLYDKNGTQLGSPVSQSVAAHAAAQVNGVFAAAGASSATSVTDANAVFTSDVPVFGFASVIDNLSNDSSFLKPLRDFAPKQ